MRLKLLLSFFLLGIVACGTNKKGTTVYEYTSFPEEKEIIGEVYDSSLSETMSFEYPRSLSVDKDYIFVLDDRNSDSDGIVFQIDKKTNTLLRKFGTLGKAGNEILRTECFQIIENQCYLFDMTNSKILCYDLDNDQNSPSNRIDLPGDLKMISSAYLCSNKDIYYSTIVDTPIVRMYNYQTKIENGYLNLKTATKVDNYGFRLFNWQSKISYNEKTKLLALGSTFGELLYLCNTDTGEEKYVIGPGGRPEDLLKNDLQTSTIFVGFFDKKIYTITKNINNKIQFKERFINVFSLEGEPLIRYKLDKEISYLTYDKKDNIFYALAPRDLHQIIKYKLE